MTGMSTPSIRGCSIRALWIFNQSFNLVFSRRFVTVERLWKQGCEQRGAIYCSVPFDAQVAESFVASKLAKEGSGQGEFPIDDPIMRYVRSLKVEEGRLWPVVEHRRSGCFILVLPMVELHQMASYEELCNRSGCGGATSDLGLSKLLLDTPCVTGALAVAQAVGDVLSGDSVEPELFATSTATMGSFLDSFTMGVGISGIAARAKPVAVPVAAAANAVAAAAATATSAITGGGRSITLRSSEKDALRSFITSAMPFGTPLDVNSVNLAAVKSNGFSSLDVPVAEQRQPMWKPYLYRGKQRMAFAVHEVITAALYDRDDVQDSISLAGEVLCRLDLEGLPEVSLQLLTPSASSTIDSLTFHLCAQAPEQGVDKQAVTFTPPLGNFVLARYTALPKTINPPLQGFYQLSMVSETEGAFLIRMRVMAGYKNTPMVMEQCSLSVPFPRRKIVGVEGIPSVGTVSQTEHSIEWKIVLGRGIPKGTEVTYPGTVKFASTKSEPQGGDSFRLDDSSDTEADPSQENESFKGERGEAPPLPADMEEPLCWEAYSFAKASIKVTGGTMSGISIDPKTVSVYPAVKTACEFSSQVLSGEYIFWNSLGRYPQAVPAVTQER